MNLEQFNKLKADVVANLGDQGRVTQLLADAETEVTTFNTRFNELEEKATTQATHIDSLQKTNMNLFLRQGNPVPDEKLQSAAPLSYDDLITDLQGGTK